MFEINQIDPYVESENLINHFRNESSNGRYVDAFYLDALIVFYRIKPQNIINYYLYFTDKSVYNELIENDFKKIGWNWVTGNTFLQGKSMILFSSDKDTSDLTVANEETKNAKLRVLKHKIMFEFLLIILWGWRLNFDFGTYTIIDITIILFLLVYGIGMLLNILRYLFVSKGICVVHPTLRILLTGQKIALNLLGICLIILVVIRMFG
jgi:hypothetical protein